MRREIQSGSKYMPNQLDIFIDTCDVKVVGSNDVE